MERYSQVHAVVQHPGPRSRCELVPQLSYFAVHYQSLQVDVCKTKDGQTGGIVATTGLEVDETSPFSHELVTKIFRDAFLGGKKG